jgi:hypothetical protein
VAPIAIPLFLPIAISHERQGRSTHSSDIVGHDAGTHKKLIDLVADHAVARAVFTETIKRRRGRIIVLGQKSRVLPDSGS